MEVIVLSAILATSVIGITFGVVLLVLLKGVK